MRPIRFFSDPNKGDLRLKVSFGGVMNIVYTFRLIAQDGNTILQNIQGESIGQDFDFNFLPPTDQYDGCTLQIFVKFRGININTDPNYNIKASLSQDGNVIAEKNSSGVLTGKIQDVSITLKLVQ